MSRPLLQPVSRRAVMKSAAAAGLAGLSSGAFAPAVAANRSIKIGYVSPQSGPLSLFGEADAFIIEGIRAVAKTGLDIGGKNYQLEIITKDNQSNPNRAAQVANELISNDNVDLVLAIAAPELVNPVSDQCELNGIPCISSICPWQAWTFSRGSNPNTGFESTFHFFWGLEDSMSVYANMWDKVSTNKQVSALVPNNEDGKAMATGALPLLKRRSYSVTPSGFYKEVNDDFSAIISSFKAANCEILTGAPIPPDFTTFWTQARQQGYRPKAASIAKAILFPAAVEALGDAGHNLSSEVWWSPSHPFHSSLNGRSAREFAEQYTASTNRQWTQPIGFVHAMYELAFDALKRSPQIGDPKALISSIATTSIDTIVGRVDWKNSPIKNVARTPLVGGQWRLTKEGKHKYALIITSNETAPSIPVAGQMEALV